MVAALVFRLANWLSPIVALVGAQALAETDVVHAVGVAEARVSVTVTIPIDRLVLLAPAVRLLRLTGDAVAVSRAVGVKVTSWLEPVPVVAPAMAGVMARAAPPSRRAAAPPLRLRRPRPPDWMSWCWCW